MPVEDLVRHTRYFITATNARKRLYNELMLTSLTRIEARIEHLLERNFVYLWQKHLDPHMVARELARALEDRASTTSTLRARRAAPSAYEVRMHSLDAAALLRSVPDFPERMATQLLQIARDLDLMLVVPPSVSMVLDDTVPENSLRISTDISQPDPEATRQITPLQDHHVSRESATEHAYLIIDGRREVALSKPLLTLGRSVENDIILEQAGVSRNHAQLRRRQQRWVLFDLNSSGGTFVNGERIFEAALQTGDVISMATAKLIFGEEQGGAGQQPQSAPIVDRTRPLHQDS